MINSLTGTFKHKDKNNNNYLHSINPQTIKIRLINNETDNPIAKVMELDLFAFIN